MVILVLFLCAFLHTKITKITISLDCYKVHTQEQNIKGCQKKKHNRGISQG